MKSVVQVAADEVSLRACTVDLDSQNRSMAIMTLQQSVNLCMCVGLVLGICPMTVTMAGDVCDGSSRGWKGLWRCIDNEQDESFSVCEP